MIEIVNNYRVIRLPDSQSQYYNDVVNNFNEFFDAVESNGMIDYSKPAIHTLRNWPFPVMLPSFCEPIESLQEYINHAKLQEGGVAIDGGGFAGITAMMMMNAVGESGTVICLEPDSVNAECIEYNFSKYKEMYGYCPTLVKKALWNNDGTLVFSQESAMGSSAVDIVGARANTINVDSITLSTLAADLDKVDYLKMDIEGAEIKAIEDRQFFNKFKPRVSIETHNAFGGMTTEGIKRYLTQYGYSFKEIRQFASPYSLIHAEYSQ